MTHPNGVALKDSLCQDYLTSFTWFVPFRAFQCRPRRHTAVVSGSISYLLAYMILLTTTAAIFKVDWTGKGSDGVVAVIPGFAALNGVVLVAAMVCGAWLFVLLTERQTGLFGDPAGISGIAALVSGSDTLDKFRELRSYDTEARIDEALGPYRLHLEHRPDQPNPYQIRLVHPEESLGVHPEQPFKQSRAEGHSWWLRGRTYLGLTAVLLFPNLYIQYAHSGKLPMNTTAMRICTTVASVAGAALWSNWLVNVAILEPYYRLSAAKHNSVGGSARALDLDFMSSSIWSFFHAMRSRTGSPFVGYISLCVLMFQLSVIVSPVLVKTSNIYLPLLQSAIADGETSSVFGSDLIPHGIFITYWTSFVLLLIEMLFLFIGLVTMMRRKRKAFLPRKPYTLSSAILYLCNSTGLLEDVQGASVLSKEARDARLKTEW